MVALSPTRPQRSRFGGRKRIANLFSSSDHSLNVMITFPAFVQGIPHLGEVSES